MLKINYHLEVKWKLITKSVKIMFLNQNSIFSRLIVEGVNLIFKNLWKIQKIELDVNE